MYCVLCVTRDCIRIIKTIKIIFFYILIVYKLYFITSRFATLTPLVQHVNCAYAYLCLFMLIYAYLYMHKHLNLYSIQFQLKLAG